MAALIRHGVLETVHRTAAPRFSIVRGGAPGPATATTPSHLRSGAGFATKAEKKKGMDRRVPPRIDTTAQSIAAKGFLRAQRAYSVPQDVEERLDVVFERAAPEAEAGTSLDELGVKFRLCTACAEEFDHAVPNSMLHRMGTLNDVREFYRTPVDVRTPLDKMRNMDLPENLHVQFEYHRFHPESDTMFKGQTAFNRSSTIVTGLKYKDKYKGHIQNTQWPFNS